MRRRLGPWRLDASTGLVFIACTQPPPTAPGLSRTSPDEPAAHAAPNRTQETSDDAGAQDEEAETQDTGQGALDSAPDTAPGHFVALPVPEQGDAIVWLPAPSPRRLPLLVVAHGAGGGPDWHCEFWSAVVREGAFVLCLRGRPLSKHYDGYYFPEHHTLAKIFERSVAAFDARFGELSDDRRSVYIGYSQGATMGSLMLSSFAARFSHALFIEGGYDTWSIARAQRFQRAGGRAVFIACGTKSCAQKSTNAARWLERAGCSASAVTAPGAGHTPDGEVGMVAVEGLQWLLRQ